MSSEILLLYCVDWQTVTDVSEQPAASGYTDPEDGGSSPLKCQQLFMNRQSITSQKM